jgi:hypothetical protein
MSTNLSKSISVKFPISRHRGFTSKTQNKGTAKTLFFGGMYALGNLVFLKGVIHEALKPLACTANLGDNLSHHVYFKS